MQEVGVVGKSGYNSFDKYKFRSIDDVYNSLQPVLAKNGVFIVPRIVNSHETTVQSQAGKDQVRVKVKVEYNVCASDGSKITSIFEGEGIDRSDKATNKAFQASFKYMVSQLFCLAFEGMDDADKESPEFISNKNQYQQKQAAPVVNKKLSNENSAYVCSFGKFKGQMIKDLDPYELNSYCHYIKEQAEQTGKAIQGKVKEFLDTAELYLSSLEVDNIDQDFPL